jgi:hypothetical protein
LEGKVRKGRFIEAHTTQKEKDAKKEEKKARLLFVFSFLFFLNAKMKVRKRFMFDIF